MNSHTTNTPVHKPVPLRVIFILNALMCVLPFVFYYVFITKDIQIGLEPIHMVYTGIAYIISFGFLAYFMNNKKLLATKIVFIVNILIALPTSAYLGILIAIISLLLSFFNKKVRNYYNA